MVRAGDSIQVAGNDNYEHVFDRSQHVDFEVIEVDDRFRRVSGNTILEVHKSLPEYIVIEKEFLVSLKLIKYSC